VQEAAEDGPMKSARVALAWKNRKTYHVMMEFSCDRNAIRTQGMARGMRIWSTKTPAAMRPETSATVNSMTKERLADQVESRGARGFLNHLNGASTRASADGLLALLPMNTRSICARQR
jgi:hypothetical protein